MHRTESLLADARAKKEHAARGARREAAQAQRILEAELRRRQPRRARPTAQAVLPPEEARPRKRAEGSVADELELAQKNDICVPPLKEKCACVPRVRESASLWLCGLLNECLCCVLLAKTGITRRHRGHRWLAPLN